MTISEINAKTAEMLAAVTAKPGIIIRHYPRFEGDLVEIRNADNSLRWRAYAFETDFLFSLGKELDRDASPKTSEDMATEAAAKRETQLRLEAMFFEQKGMDDFEVFTCGEFSREEVEAEILKMNAEQITLQQAKQQTRVMKTYSVSFCNSKNSNPAPIVNSFISEDAMHIWARAYCDSHNAFCGYTFKEIVDNTERLETARVRINLAYGAIQAGATLEYAINSVAGAFEADGGISPFDCDGFAKAFTTALQSDQQTVDALVTALSVDLYGFHFDNRQMRVTTLAGMKLIAPVWRVQLKNGPIAQLWAWWDMRYELNRNTSYLALVSQGDVSNIEYV